MGRIVGTQERICSCDKLKLTKLLASFTTNYKNIKNNKEWMKKKDEMNCRFCMQLV